MTNDYQEYEAMAAKLDVDADQQEGERDAAELVVRAAEAGDVGAPFEPAAVEILRAQKVQHIANWQRQRERLKKAGVGITELEKIMHHGDGAPAREDDETVADKLIALARSQCQFVHDAQRESYAVFGSAGARQVYGVNSSGFSDYLSHLYYSEHDRAPTETSLKVALATLRGQAQFDGESCAVHTRVAKTDAGYWLDLCNEAWECVHITSTGWAVVKGDGAPLFTRSASMRPLPMPQRGGTLDTLWPLVNIPTADRMMILTWLLECLRTDTPYVVLELVGEQGSVKSTTQKFLRRLFDPNQADLRAAPKSVEDVWIAARNAHLVSLENLSHLQPQYQDALCVLATGGGYSARTLYTNVEETILELRKPIVLNGISVIVTAQDLLDRCLHIELANVQNRELASEMENRFEIAQPKLLGALLDLFSQVLVKLPSVNIAPEKRPRTADFAYLGEAVFRVHGKKDGEFLSQYNAMRKAGVHRTIDSSPVGAALLAYLVEVPAGWNGSLSDLLGRLERFRPHGDASWPRSGKGLGDALRRLAPALRMIGYDAKSEGKTGGAIRWHIYLATEKLSKQSPASPASPSPGTAGDEAKAGHARHAGHGLDSSGRGKGVSPETDIVEADV